MNALALAFALFAAPVTPASDCVVLLHGLGRTPLSMGPLQLALRMAGYTVWNHGYPSTSRTVEELAPVVGDAIDACRARAAPRIHFVTHSMGGILLRRYFQDHAVPEVHRVVMLAPPNHGSEVVDAYRGRWWFKALTGPAGQQLGTEPESAPNSLAPIPLEVGVIAGSSTSDPWFGRLFAAEHDGKVSVASARLAEMADLLVVPHGHTFMVNSPAVIEQVMTFLQTGVFRHAGTGGSTDVVTTGSPATR